MNIQAWSPLGSTGLSSLFLQHQFESINSSMFSLLYCPTLTSIHNYWKNYSLDYTHLCGQSDVLLFDKLSVIPFLQRSKCLFNFMAAVTIHSDFGAQENSLSLFHCFPIYWHEMMALDAMILILWVLNFKTAFSLSSFTFIKRLFIKKKKKKFLFAFCH